MKELDVRGSNCPEPVLLVQEAIKNNEKKLIIMCDCVNQNIESLLQKNHYMIEKKTQNSYCVYSCKKNDLS